MPWFMVSTGLHNYGTYMLVRPAEGYLFTCLPQACEDYQRLGLRLGSFQNRVSGKVRIRV